MINDPSNNGIACLVHAHRLKTELELNRLVKDGIIAKVSNSDWAIVTVLEVNENGFIKITNLL